MCLCAYVLMCMFTCVHMFVCVKSSNNASYVSVIVTTIFTGPWLTTSYGGLYMMY